MQDRHKIHIALPRRPAIRSALENALRTASNLHLGNYDLTDEIDDAEVVVTDSETQSKRNRSAPRFCAIPATHRLRFGRAKYDQRRSDRG